MLKYLLCIIHVYSKYACVNSASNKNAKTDQKRFYKKNESNHTPNKLGVDQGK